MVSAVGAWMVIALVGAGAMAGPGAAPGAPRIDDRFAVSSLWQGQIWKIFVSGSDPDGDMDYIWLQVSQLGGNMWDNHLVRLHGANQSSFSGYISFPTQNYTLRRGWETVRVEMRIRDRAGHYSAPVTLEVEIGSPTRQAVPEKWARVANNQLGTVIFNFDTGADSEMGNLFRR
jgi:hypothetical protein